MIKVKDGYVKLIGTTYSGSVNRVLLSNGGDHILGNSSGNIPLNNGTVNTNLNADMLDGLHIHAGRNNEANKIVRTDANGFLLTGWINTTSGDIGTGAINKIYCSNDGYIRYKTPANFFSTLANNGDNISITVASLNRTLTVQYANIAGLLRSKGTIAPLTGRTLSLGDVYSYHLNTSVSGGPTTYAAVIGFGKGTAGTVEIAGEWTGGRGIWVRALRDTTDNWYSWDKILTLATYTGITDSRYYTKTESNNRFVNVTGDTMTGTLTTVTTGSNSYNQGIRINRTATNQWATLLIGKSGTATTGTGTSTAGDGAWLIATPASSNSLVFNLNSASETVGLCLKGHGNTDIKWNNNTVWHAGNDGSGSGLDADLLDGNHASAFATALHNHDDRYIRKWTGVYGSANKFLKLVIGNEKGWVRLEVSDSNNNLTAGYGIYMIGWGWHGDNGTDTLFARCLYANNSRYTTALKIVRTSRNNYDLYFLFASSSSYPSYTINYSNSVSSIDCTVTAITTIPTATWTSSLSALLLNASLVDWSGVTNKPKYAAGDAIGGSANYLRWEAAASSSYARKIPISWGDDVETTTTRFRAVYSNSLTYRTDTNTISSNISGNAATATKLNSRGNLEAYIEGSTTKGESGVNLYTVYNNGYPVTFGNLLHINGSGAGQLLAEWCGSSARGHLYYRSKRDNADNGWSTWGKIAFVTDNVVSASKWATVRKITLSGSVTGSVSLDGSGDVTLATTTNHTHNWTNIEGKPSTFTPSTHNHSFITIPACSTLNINSDNFSVEYAGGNNSVTTKPSGVDAFGVMKLRTAAGWYGQIMMSTNTAPGMYYRNANGLTSSIGWIKLLDSSNSNVSGGGSAWGSSITVNINGTSKTLTIPGNPNTDYRVTQSETTTANYRPLVLGYTNVSTAGSGMTGSVTNQVYLSNKFYVQPSTGNLYATNFVGTLSGNASSATKLQTARTIWGQSFNGTANVDNTLRIRQTTGNYCEGIRIQTDDGAWSTIILGATADSGTNANAWSIHRKADNNFAISRNSSDGINGLVMTSVGMGLGTTTPTHRLDVRGDTKITGSIRDLAIGGGIYWNPYVESTTDGSDAASITVVKSGIAGGTTLVLSLMNDANDTILFLTSTTARLYHNSYPILTTLNTYVSNNKGYINNTEITLVNNSDTVDGFHYYKFVYNSSFSYNRNGPYYKKIASVNTANWTWSAASLIFLVFSTGYSNGVCYLGTVEVMCGHWNNTDHDPSVTCRWILKVPNSGNRIVTIKNLDTNTVDVYLANDLWDCGITFNVVYNNGFSILNVSLTDGGFVNLPTASSTVIHYIPSNPTYVGNSTSATNSDTLDNYHANGLLTALSNSNNGVSITIGGTTKSISNISVNYANYSGYATRLDGGAIAGWGTLTSSNGFSGIAAYDWKNKGAFCWAGKSGQMYMQVDGWFYQNEGRYRVLDTSDAGSLSVKYASSAGNADTVDGLHANAFATASHSHPYLPLSGGTMTGLIVGNNKGGSWISGRSNAAIYQYRTTTDDWHPVVGFKTKTGSWEFGNVGNDDFATFSWGSDSNYSSGANATTIVHLRNTGGTIALTSDIPTKSSWNYDDVYSKLGHTHDNRYYTESEINSKLGTYLPLSGGTMTGALNFKNGTWNLMGDDAYIGDCNVAGMIGVKGANAATPGFALYNNSGTLLGKLYASGSTLIWSGGTIQATTFNGNATTASKWAIARTLTLTGSVTGNVSIDGSGNVTLATTTNHTHNWTNIEGKPNTFTPSSHTHDDRYYTESEVNNLLSNKLNISNFNWTNLSGKLVVGNEFNIVNDGFNTSMWFNHSPINDRSKTASIDGYHFGNGAGGYTSIKASGFIKNGSNGNYVLLGDGGHKAISNFATSGHTHTLTLASDTGANPIVLEHGGKYKLTAGGNSVIFTLPTSNNVDPTNYYWANINVSTTSSTKTSPKFSKVMINTATSSYQLNVGGDSYVSGWSHAASGFHCVSYGVYFTHNNSLTSAGEIDITSTNEFCWGSKESTLYFNYRAASRGTTVTKYIWNAGSSSSYASHTMGDITATSINASGNIYAAHFYENSDIRYKRILRNLLINSNTIAALPLFDFEWIENNTTGIGTSAQAVQQILPNLVSGTDKLTLDYGVLGTIAGITACKELVTLKSELLQLKEKVKLLEDKLRKYENI